MNSIRKFVRTLTKTIVVFASLHLGILAFHALLSGDWNVWRLQDILDIRFLYDNAMYNTQIEGALWIMLLSVMGYWWTREGDK